MSDREESIQIEGLCLEELLQLHLDTKSCPWTVQNSQLHGQGLFAARPIEEGEVIFRDVALVLGPRSGPSKDALCVSCLSSSTLLRPCSRRCRLPVCSPACENSPEHQPECEFLRQHCRPRHESTSDRSKQSEPLDVKGLKNQKNGPLTGKRPITQKNDQLFNGHSIDRQTKTNSITEENTTGSNKQRIDTQAQPNGLTEVRINDIDGSNKSSINGQDQANSIREERINSPPEPVNRQAQLNGSTEENTNGLHDSTNKSINGSSHQSSETQDQQNGLSKVSIDRIDDLNKPSIDGQAQSNSPKEESVKEINASNLQDADKQNQAIDSSKQSLNRQTQPNGLAKDSINGSADQITDRQAQQNSPREERVKEINSSNMIVTDLQSQPNEIIEDGINGSTHQRLDKQAETIGSSKQSLNRQSQSNGITDDIINGSTDQRIDKQAETIGSCKQSLKRQSQSNRITDDIINGSTDQRIDRQAETIGSSRQSLNRQSQSNGITDDIINGSTDQRIDKQAEEIGSSKQSQSNGITDDIINGSTDQRIDRQAEVIGSSKQSLNRQRQSNGITDDIINGSTDQRTDSQPNSSSADNLGDIDLELVRTVTPLRCLQMSKLKRAIMKSLECIEHPVCEIDILKRHLSSPLPPATEAYLRRCCGTLDANAYGGTGHGKTLNFRGLYALSALMNHSCAPNTTYFFDSQSRMVVKAARRIKAREEILSTYTSLLWGTATRRSFLNNTKTFLCRCVRCRDATEFGSRLSGIRCKARPCGGVLLPADPLQIRSEWICDAGSRAHRIGAPRAFQVLNVCSKVAEMLTRNEDLAQIRTFLRSVPDNAQSAVQIRKHFVLHAKGAVTDVSDEKLLFKAESCDKLLDLIALLKLGGNYLRGLILKELYLVLQEKSRRFPDEKVELEVLNKIKTEYETILSA